MDPLLSAAVDAHGGIDNLRQVTKLTAKLSVSVLGHPTVRVVDEGARPGLRPEIRAALRTRGQRRGGCARGR
jgi:hypothetical protein